MIINGFVAIVANVTSDTIGANVSSGAPHCDSQPRRGPYKILICKAPMNATAIYAGVTKMPLQPIDFWLPQSLRQLRQLSVRRRV
jgi:hypothetical protein